MTFLLFLASLVALEFIVLRSGATPGNTKIQAPPQEVRHREPSLMALAHAVERQGSGQIVDPTRQESTLPKFEVDRV